MAFIPLIAVVGAMIIVAAYLLTRKRSKAMRAGALVAAFAIVVALSAWLRYAQQPVVTQTASDSAFDASMSRIPLWRAILDHDPATAQQLRDQVTAMERQGRSEQEKIDAIQQQILLISMQRLQQTSDAEAVAYMRSNMEMTAALQKHGDDICFRYLFPAVKGGVNPVRYLTQEQIDSRMAADADMYNASFGANKHSVTEAEREQAHRDLEPILQRMNARYGADLDLMAHPEKAQGKEGQLCYMVQGLWQEVFNLPMASAAGVIRYSVSSR